MRYFAILIALFVAFGSLVPHPALAHRHATTMSTHHMSKTHAPATSECTTCTGDCIGCAAPLRMGATSAVIRLAASPPHRPFLPASLAAFVTSLELPPPRPIA
jgi:hypothetical protein